MTSTDHFCGKREVGGKETEVAEEVAVGNVKVDEATSGEVEGEMEGNKGVYGNTEGDACDGGRTRT